MSASILTYPKQKTRKLHLSLEWTIGTKTDKSAKKLPEIDAFALLLDRQKRIQYLGQRIKNSDVVCFYNPTHPMQFLNWKKTTHAWGSTEAFEINLQHMPLNYHAIAIYIALENGNKNEFKWQDLTAFSLQIGQDEAMKTFPIDLNTQTHNGFLQLALLQRQEDNFHFSMPLEAHETDQLADILALHWKGESN